MYLLIPSVTDRLKLSIFIFVTVSVSNYVGSAEQVFQGQTSYCGVTLQEAVNNPLNHMDELMENPWFVPIYFYDVHERIWKHWNDGIFINNSTIIIVAEDNSQESIVMKLSTNLEKFRAVVDVNSIKMEYSGEDLVQITDDNFSQLIEIDRISLPQIAKRDDIFIGERKQSFALLHLKQQIFFSEYTIDACIPLPSGSNQSGSCDSFDMLPSSNSLLLEFNQLFALRTLTSQPLKSQKPQLDIDNEMKLSNVTFSLWEDQFKCQQYWYECYNDAFPENNVLCLEISQNLSKNAKEHHPQQLIVLGKRIKISTPHFISNPFIKQTFVAGIAVKPDGINEDEERIRNEPCRNPSVYFFRPINKYIQGMLGELSGKLGCEPFPLLKGSKSTCEYGKDGWPYSVGSQVKVECKQHYVSKEEMQYRKFHCSSNNLWNPQPYHFGCKIDCGKRFPTLEPLVVRGWPTTSLEFPWYGAMYLKSLRGGSRLNHNYDFICGSTLISESVLVTAAHCFYSYETKSFLQSQDIQVILGSSVRNFDEARKQGRTVQTYSIKTITPHPDFNPVTLENDIALMKLTKDVELTEYVLPACFPYSSSTSGEYGIGEVAGMGIDESGQLSKFLKTASLPVVNLSECEKSLGRHIANTQFCAGHTNGTSTCKGDSGSGLVFSQKVDSSGSSQASGRFYVRGIVSNSARLEGTNQCDDKNYVVFTKTSSFVDWVADTINKYDTDM